MKIYIVIIIILASFLGCYDLPVQAAEKEKSFKEYVAEGNEHIKVNNHFQAIDAFKKAIETEAQPFPALHMRLGVLYYGLGLISEAVVEVETAVQLRPTSKWYKFDLTKFYLVSGQLDKAIAQCVELLELDPGFTVGYYYLAELFYQQGKYDLAWFSLQRAYLLSHKSKHLEEKLADKSSKPTEDFDTIEEDETLLRFIMLPDPQQAKYVVERIESGKLFEVQELELRKKQIGQDNFGLIQLGELNDKVALSLLDVPLYGAPVIINTDGKFMIVQRIMPFSLELWNKQLMANTNADPIEGENRGDERKDLSTVASQKNEVLTPKDSKPRVRKMSLPKNFEDKLAAYHSVLKWEKAWRTQDIDSYLAAYAREFLPEGGKSHQMWEKERRLNLAQPGTILIKVEDIMVEELNEQTILITFTQSYISDIYKDRVVKELSMDKDDGKWLIIRERVVKKLKMDE